MNKKWFVSIILILLALTFPFVFPRNKVVKVEIGGKTITAEIAKTDTQRVKGLSGRDHLDNDKGMLFVFPQNGLYSFWMKNTKIPLDIIWINNNKIADQTTLDPQIDDQIPQYTPKNPANYVLEVNAGFLEENQIKIGDEVKLNF